MERRVVKSDRMRLFTLTAVYSQDGDPLLVTTKKYNHIFPLEKVLNCQFL